MKLYYIGKGAKHMKYIFKRSTFLLFLEDSSLDSIKIKFYGIILLNITDSILTFLALKTGFMIEANPIMRGVVDNLFYSLLLKILVSTSLLFFIFKRLRKASKTQLTSSNSLTNFIFLYYLFVNMWNLSWFLYFVLIY